MEARGVCTGILAIISMVAVGVMIPGVLIGATSKLFGNSGIARSNWCATLISFLVLVACIIGMKLL